MNWGKGIAITLTLFIGFITVLVINMISAKVDLVNEDYYAKEMGFQDKIDAQNNVNNLDIKPKITEDKEDINFFLPPESNISDVQVNFYRPSDEEGDKEFKIDSDNSFSLSKSNFESGNYDVTLNFNIGKETYSLKKSVYL